MVKYPAGAVPSVVLAEGARGGGLRLDPRLRRLRVERGTATVQQLLPRLPDESVAATMMR
jgi:hypothetical protein